MKAECRVQYTFHHARGFATILEPKQNTEINLPSSACSHAQFIIIMGNVVGSKDTMKCTPQERKHICSGRIYNMHADNAIGYTYHVHHMYTSK